MFCIFLLRPQEGHEVFVMSMSDCLYVCLSVPSQNSITTWQILATCGHGSIFFWRRCNTLSTSGFVDDITFLYHGTNGPEASMTLYFDKVRQLVAEPVGRQTTSVWSSLSECSTGGEVCYLWLPFTECRLKCRVAWPIRTMGSRSPRKWANFGGIYGAA